MQSLDDISFLQDLLSIYSPSGRERRACVYLKSVMSRWGFESVRIDRAGNVLGEKGRGRPVILLCSHVDTVPGKQRVKHDDNKIFGRGAVDAKGPLAAMVLAAREHVGAGRLVFCAAVGEEADSRGVAHLSSLPRMADVAVFGEPTGLRAAAFAYRGSISVRLNIYTTGGHSASPWGYKNAVEEAFLLAEKIKNSLGCRKGKFSNPSVVITRMRGGAPGNRIPERASMLLDVRFPPPFCTDEMFRKIRGIVEGASGGYECSVEILDGTEPYVAQKDSVVVECLREAVGEVLNSRLMLVRKTGTGDMGLIGRRWKIPVITYGPCDPRLSHTSREYVDLEEFRAAIKIYGLTCQRIAASLHG